MSLSCTPTTGWVKLLSRAFCLRLLPLPLQAPVVCDGRKGSRKGAKSATAPLFMPPLPTAPGQACSVGRQRESLRRAAKLFCSSPCRPHHNVTGGMKCLVEHIRLLRSRGHCLVAVHRSDSATAAMPPWSEVQADKDIVCGLHQRLGDVYPLADIDVVVVGIFHQVGEQSGLLWAGVDAFAACQTITGSGRQQPFTESITLPQDRLCSASLGSEHGQHPEVSLTSCESLTVWLH